MGEVPAGRILRFMGTEPALVVAENEIAAQVYGRPGDYERTEGKSMRQEFNGGVGMTKVVVAGPVEGAEWVAYVNAHPASTFAHLWPWKRIFETACSHRTFYLMAVRDSLVCGVLPLVLQKSTLFGSFLTSMPFLNSGGILADDTEAERALLRKAEELTQGSGAKYLQLRHRDHYTLPLRALTHKVSPVKRISADVDSMFSELDKKVRTDIRKARSYGLTASPEGSRALSEFYGLYVENMRRLGTPSYGLKLYREILRAFDDIAEIVVVRYGDTAVAASFLLRYRDSVEALWSASRADFLHMKPNMLLYWENLCLAARLGCKHFDFGRSTRNSGTHKFKQQWGTQDVQLHWGQWPELQGDVAELSPANPRYHTAIQVWKRLPLLFTRTAGPYIARKLP